jgi:virginiamycin B lyase
LHCFTLVGSIAVAVSAANAETVQYFPVPEGAGPHDVAPAPDGRVWYTAQGQGALGRLDPKSGEVKQVPLGDGSAPHGVIVGPDGAAWVTDGGLNAIVRVDPATLEVKTYPLPDPDDNANLNTPAFGKDGILWFTGQNGIYGSLDPKTGKMAVYEDPEGRGPYGITATPDGTVYYASLAGSHIARIDVATANPPSSSRRPRIRARAASGRIRRAASGSANGNRDRSRPTIPRPTAGTAGACRATGRKLMRSMSTTRTRCG